VSIPVSAGRPLFHNQGLASFGGRPSPLWKSGRWFNLNDARSHRYTLGDQGGSIAQNAGSGTTAGPKSEMATTRPNDELPRAQELVFGQRHVFVRRRGRQSLTCVLQPIAGLCIIWNCGIATFKFC
jgi:hypothetical protein